MTEALFSMPTAPPDEAVTNTKSQLGLSDATTIERQFMPHRPPTTEANQANIGRWTYHERV
jgi:hypothetical protein